MSFRKRYVFIGNFFLQSPLSWSAPTAETGTIVVFPVTYPQIDLQRGREKLVDLEEHLERRHNANAKKSAELKLNEDKLEAVSARCVFSVLLLLYLV